MMISSSSSSSSAAAAAHFVSSQGGGGHPPPAPLYEMAETDPDDAPVAASALPGNARFMATLHRTPATAPTPPSSPPEAPPRSTAAQLSPNAFVQVRQREAQRAAAHAHHGAAPSSRDGDADTVQPAWWSRESSVLPRESSGRTSSYASSTVTSASASGDGRARTSPTPPTSASAAAAAAKMMTTLSPVRRDAAYVADLRRRVEAQTRPPAQPHVASADAFTPPRTADAVPREVRGARVTCAVAAGGQHHDTPSSASSEAGTTPVPQRRRTTGRCGCACYGDDDVDGSSGSSGGAVCSSCRPIDVQHVHLRPYRQRRRDSSSCGSGRSEADSRGVSSAYCVECGCHCDTCPGGGSDGARAGDDGSRRSSTDTSLCSACRAAADAAAAAAARHRRHSEDPFLEAVRTDGMWAAVPPLLHLTVPSRGRGAAAGGRRLDDAAVQALREREERREAYLRSAAALQRTDAGGRQAGGETAAASQGSSAHAPMEPSTAEGVGRTPTAPMEDAAAEAAAVVERGRREEAEEEDRRRAIAAAAAQSCAAMTLPLLQGELATHAARTAAEQRAHLEAAVAQMRELHEAARRQSESALAQERATLLQERRELEAERRARELAAAATARVEAGTSPVDAALLTAGLPAAAVPPPALLARPTSPAPPTPPVLPDASLQRGHVGTQHSDGTRELLTVVRADAAAWVAQHLLELECMQRAGIEDAESTSRHVLVHFAEATCRRQLLQCQGEVLVWKREVLIQQQHATSTAAVQTLKQQERRAREELAREAELGSCAMARTQEKQRHELVAAAARAQMAQLTADLAATRESLQALQAEHADAQAQARQLRLQLVHALRMPTVTLVERSGVPRGVGGDGVGGDGASSAAAAARAYAHATATFGPESDRASLGEGAGLSGAAWRASSSASCAELEDLPVHRRFARAHQEALRVTRAQTRTV